LRIVTGFELAKTVLSRRAQSEEDVDARETTVREIIGEVRRRGDKALYDYTEKFDGVKLTSLQVAKEQIAAAYQRVDDKVVSAINLATERIRAFHTAQKNSLLRESTKGGMGWLIRPLERIGIHVPGFSSPLPSSLLMTVIPARVAGVGQIMLVTPPQKGGEVAPVTLVAADIAGVDRIYSVGGAQAIAALAFGTETIASVDKIIGPGNAFVIAAKKLLYGVVGIDALQGPSEVLIIADETATIEYCAADLLAQAEHASGSAVLVATSIDLADRISREVDAQLKSLPRPDVASESLGKNGIVAVVESVDEAVELANLYAPEHLLLMVDKASTYVEKVHNAGCIVTGKKGTVVLGDYVAGPSHVLPTGGTARFASPLSVFDFVKLTSVINVDDNTLKKIGPAAQVLATTEGLDAHARAVEKRLKTG
jgi:histidinol dehydrogenase